MRDAEWDNGGLTTHCARPEVDQRFGHGAEQVVVIDDADALGTLDQYLATQCRGLRLSGPFEDDGAPL